ncbi:hypothetical protein OAU50_05745 [Planctomycetota bacterium]|nr:hypothetical protein [Planctomycetota bacterium]
MRSFIRNTLIVLVVLGVLGVAAISLVSETGQHAPRREAEAVAGTIKTKLRGMYSRTKIAPRKRTLDVYEILERAHGYHVAWAEYYRVDSKTGKIIVHLRDRVEGWLEYAFNYESGHGLFQWHEYEG